MTNDPMTVQLHCPKCGFLVGKVTLTPEGIPRNSMFILRGVTVTCQGCGKRVIAEV